MQELISIVVVIYAIKILLDTFKSNDSGCGKCNCRSN